MFSILSEILLASESIFLVSILIFGFVWLPVWKKYKNYAYLSNLRWEIVTIFRQLLLFSIGIILIFSTLILIIKTPMGLTKVVLMIKPILMGVLLYLFLPHLKPLTSSDEPGMNRWLLISCTIGIWILSSWTRNQF